MTEGRHPLSSDRPDDRADKPKSFISPSKNQRFRLVVLPILAILLWATILTGSSGSYEPQPEKPLATTSSESESSDPTSKDDSPCNDDCRDQCDDNEACRDESSGEFLENCVEGCFDACVTACQRAIEKLDWADPGGSEPIDNEEWR